MAGEQAAVDQRGVEPVQRRLRHLVAHPEALGDRHLRVIQPRGDVDARARTVAFERQPAAHVGAVAGAVDARSEEHTSELQSLMRISYAVFCLKTQNKNNKNTENET